MAADGAKVAVAGRTVRLALVGAPNSGKTTLFNGLTGGRAKVGNYAGVTVESRVGRFATTAGRAVELIDLPGVYGLTARSSDEAVTIEALKGGLDGAEPDALIVVIDACCLRTHLQSALQLKTLGRPMVVAVNMMDLAERDGLELDVAAIEARLGVPVVAVTATRSRGRAAFLDRLDSELSRLDAATAPAEVRPLPQLQKEARAIASAATVREAPFNKATRAVDAVVLHPVAGPAIFFAILFVIFQAVFAWAAPAMDGIEGAFGALGDAVAAATPDGWLRSLIVDGAIAGVGSVLVFLPQILIMFAALYALEASGYMARAAYLADGLMRKAGLNGRALIPLLSGFACAIPGMMAARTMSEERDRLTTILVTPLMTCSARLPVYTLMIAAFIPATPVGPFNLQGIVLFALFLSGILSALIVAAILRRTSLAGPEQPLLMEMPTYKLPTVRDLLATLWDRAGAFVKRAGGLIFATSVLLWFLASYPASDDGVRGSFAGMIGRVLEPVLRPIGFNLEIAIALVPGMAAREVAVASLGTVYALSGDDDAVAAGLTDVLASAWELPTALAFLAWYVFAPMCFATIAVARRETQSWKWTGFMVGYLFVAAYVAAGATYWIARAFVA
ncbi:MAG: ferrous iron transport protein B [Pseudomonadota bacterium]